MQRLLKMVPVALMMTISLVSGTASATVQAPSALTTITVTPSKTAIKSVQVRVASIKVQKPKFFAGNPHRLVLFADDYDTDFLDIDDIITPYRRKDLTSIKTDATEDNPEALSEDIQWKLFLARQLALVAYRTRNTA